MLRKLGLSALNHRLLRGGCDWRWVRLAYQCASAKNSKPHLDGRRPNSQLASRVRRQHEIAWLDPVVVASKEELLWCSTSDPAVQDQSSIIAGYQICGGSATTLAHVNSL